MSLLALLLNEHEMTSVGKSVTILPYVTVQHDLNDVIQDVVDGTVISESFWISVYREGTSTVHGRVNVKSGLEVGSVELTSQDGIEVERLTSTSLRITCRKLLAGPSLVLLPRQTLRDVIGKGINCMSVSADGKLFVVGGANGRLEIRQANEKKTAPLVLTGHLGDVLSCRFFPSSKVVLSTSSDLSARVYSAVDGILARTLTGHSAAVTDSAIVGIGKHVLTSSNDGTVKLWHIGSSGCVKTWRIGMAGAKRKVSHVSWVSATVMTAELYGTAFAANESGHIFAIDVAAPASQGAQEVIGQASVGAAIGALAVSGLSDTSCLVAIGTVKGNISLYRYSYTQAGPTAEAQTLDLLSIFMRNTAEITCIAFGSVDTDSVTLVISTSDGLPFSARVSLRGGDVSVTGDFGGYDLDACNSITTNAQDVYSAGNDGHVRLYQSS